MKIKASEAVPGQFYECAIGKRWIMLKHNENKSTLLYGRDDGLVWVHGRSELTHLPNCTGWEDQKPPKPEKRYRAFASFQEWWPHRERWVKHDGCVQKRPWYSVAQAEHDLDVMGAVFLNDDGSVCEPFGVEVSE